MNVILFGTEAIFSYIPTIYIVIVLVLWEGLLGGAAYVNTFHKINTKVRILLYSTSTSWSLMFIKHYSQYFIISSLYQKYKLSSYNNTFAPLLVVTNSIWSFIVLSFQSSSLSLTKWSFNQCPYYKSWRNNAYSFKWTWFLKKIFNSKNRIYGKCCTVGTKTGTL